MTHDHYNSNVATKYKINNNNPGSRQDHLKYMKKYMKVHENMYLLTFITDRVLINI